MQPILINCHNEVAENTLTFPFSWYIIVAERQQGGENVNVLELKAAMARKEISIPRLGELLGIGKQTIYSRFSGKTQFTLIEIQKIRIILDLSDEELLIIFFNPKVA